MTRRQGQTPRPLNMIAVIELPDGSSIQLQARVGLHCGPVAAGVLGRKRSVMCLVGDTMVSGVEGTGWKEEAGHVLGGRHDGVFSSVWAVGQGAWPSAVRHRIALSVRVTSPFVPATLCTCWATDRPRTAHCPCTNARTPTFRSQSPLRQVVLSPPHPSLHALLSMPFSACPS